MMWKITPSQIEGELEVPPSKSQSMRALLFALLAKGRSRIENLLESPDVEAMLRACKLLGAAVKQDGKRRVEIQGLNGSLSGAEDVIHAGNSGLVYRLIGAVAALGDLPIIITGDASIRNRRPIAPLLEALSQLKVEAYSTRKMGGAPILIRGPLQSGIAIMDGADSQPVSGLLIAAAFSKESIEINVKNAGEKPWIDLTLYWFRKLGISYQSDHYEKYFLNKQATIDGFEYAVPADWSSLAYPVAAALLTGSEICIRNVDFQDPQGDKKLIFLMQKMGASIEMDEAEKLLIVKRTGFLEGSILDINDCIDALPLLAVMGCFAKGMTRLTHCEIARKKESDRISSIVKELKKMGGQIEEVGDDIVIHESQLQGAALESHNDHRIALSLTVAALAATGESTIHNVECVSKSYPHFQSQMEQLGARIGAL